MTRPARQNVTVIALVPAATKYAKLSFQCAATASKISSTTAFHDTVCGSWKTLFQFISVNQYTAS